MRIMVTGAKGMLGSDLVEVLADGHKVIGIGREDFDISNVQAIDFLVSLRPELIIHTAAYTDVDGCELNPEKAYLDNAIGSRNVALGCQRMDIPMVYISTDYVFNGTKKEPYLEFDAPNPLNVYGKSKLAGEVYVRHLLSKFYIVRTSWLYGQRGKNFVKTILELTEKEKELRVVDDQVGSPTYSLDLARAIGRLIASQLFGIYHITNLGSCSWYEFAQEILALAGKEGLSLKPISSQELNRPAPRPPYSVLENFCWEASIGEKMREWKDALTAGFPRIFMETF